MKTTIRLTTTEVKHTPTETTHELTFSDESELRGHIDLVRSGKYLELLEELLAEHEKSEKTKQTFHELSDKELLMLLQQRDLPIGRFYDTNNYPIGQEINRRARAAHLDTELLNAIEEDSSSNKEDDQ